MKIQKGIGIILVIIIFALGTVVIIEEIFNKTYVEDWLEKGNIKSIKIQ